MNNLMLAGLIALVVGVAGMGIGQFTYTKDSESVELGPVALSVEERETVNVPTWAGAGVAALGVGLLIAGGLKRT